MLSFFTKKQPLEKLYSDHLSRVSRSFAFCIEELSSPLKEDISLAYILCRIVDTVEDSLWEDKKQQEEAFQRFMYFLDSPPSAETAKVWSSSFPESIPEEEKKLLQDSHIFFQALLDLPVKKKQILLRSILNMTRGMQHFCTRQEKIQLKSHQETNQYCFFVAGVVGELLSELLHHETEAFELSQKTYQRSIHFGLFLQKINLLKDQMKDLKEERQLIFDRKEVRATLREHADQSFEYILSIPPSQKGYRIFCSWSFFLGLISLPYIDRSWEVKKSIKISRIEAFAFLKKIKANILDEDWLLESYRKSWENLGELISKPLALQEAPWFLEAYTGPLTTRELQSLKMLTAPL